MAYRNLLIFAFGIFAVLNTELGIVGILPELAKATGNSISKVGYLIGAFALTVTFAGPLFTVFILRHVERKTACLIAQILLTTTNLLFILFPFYPILFIARILGGLGHPLFFTVSLSYAAQCLPPERRTLGVSIIFSGINIAAIIGFPIIAFLASTFSYKAGIGFSLLMNFLSFLSVLIFVPKDSFGKRETSVSVGLSSFKDRNFLVSIPVITILFTGIFIMYSYFSPYLRDIWGLNSDLLAKSLFYYGIFGLLGNILFGFVPTSKIVKTFGIVTLLLTLVYFSLAYQGYFSIFVLIPMWGFLQSGVTLLGQVWFTLNKKASSEAVNSLLVSSCNLGITIGSILGGALIPHIGIALLPWIGGTILFSVLAGIYLEAKKQQKFQLQSSLCDC